LIYIDATNKTLYGWDASIPDYYKLVADVKVPTKTSDLINDGNGTEGSRYATVQQLALKKTVYTAYCGSEYSMGDTAIVNIENFPYTTFDSIPMGTTLEIIFMNPYISGNVNDAVLNMNVNNTGTWRVLVTEGMSDGYYNPATMGAWKANDVLTFVKGRSWMLTMISGKVINGAVAQADLANRAWKDFSGNTFESTYARISDVSRIENSYLKSASVENDILTITNQSGSKIQFKGGSASGGTKINWRKWTNGSL
jgi:hypothetical protein